MKMKKAAVLICAIFLLTLCGCGDTADQQSEDTATVKLQDIQIDELVEPGYIPEGFVQLDGSEESYCHIYGNDPNDNITIEVMEGKRLDMPLEPSELDERIEMNMWKESQASFGDKEFRIVKDELSPNNIGAFVINKGYVISIWFSTGDDQAVSKKQEEEFNKVLKNLKFAD